MVHALFAEHGEPSSVDIVEKIENTEGVYSMEIDCGRQGTIHGIFIATSEMIHNAIGQYVYFGEILGKHSDVGVTLRTSDFTLLSEDPLTIRVFRNGNFSSGYNPFDYME